MQDRITVGNVEIIAALDMVPPSRSPSNFFPDVPESGWDPYRNDVLEDDQVQLYYGCFAVRSQGRTIMVDTGIGPGPHPERGNKTGDLINQLKRLGVTPEDIDIVVHSHLHVDHVGWNLDTSTDPPTPYFPNARYLVPSVDWDHFTVPENLRNAPWVSENVVPLEKLSLMELFDDGFNVTDEITSLATPGHTPGHMVFLISSQGQKAAITGDVLHNKVQVQEASWCAAIDTDKAASERSREDLLNRAVAEDYLIAAGHFHPDEHFGRVVMLEGKRYWRGV